MPGDRTHRGASVSTARRRGRRTGARRGGHASVVALPVPVMRLPTIGTPWERHVVVAACGCVFQRARLSSPAQTGWCDGHAARRDATQRRYCGNEQP